MGSGTQPLFLIRMKLNFYWQQPSIEVIPDESSLCSLIHCAGSVGVNGVSMVAVLIQFS